MANNNNNNNKNNKASTSTLATKNMTNNSNNKSCITNMAHDQLYSVLLLLPIESILSLSMTCKRFKPLASSEPLWEFLCRRDFGSPSIDAILSSPLDPDHHLSWRTLYQQVSQLGFVNCSKLLSGPASNCDFSLVPIPRASHSLNFVSRCLVLFGGGCEGGRHVDDTWVAYVGNELRRVPRWQKLNSGVPSGRFGHSCVILNKSLVLFGGINDSGIRHNDTWLGLVLHDEMNGINLSWMLLDVGSIAPPPRGAHAGCCVDERKMVIHGGIGLYGLRLSDIWVLDLSDDIRSAAWHEIATQLSPPARSGHTLTCIGGNRMVMFGGRGLGYEVLNDVWLLDIREEYPKWVQLIYDPSNIPKGIPLPRVGHSATLVLGGKILIYGGEDSCRHRKGDFWLLDINAIPSVKADSYLLDSKSLSKMWRRLKAEGLERPNCRSFHRACADDSGRYVYVFGGMVDGTIQPAESTGLGFDGDLFLVELGLQI
ncbi:hypothetical protein Syun_024809 [Stephania yunnanensis]|uniref:F-box domain-containing protein n=1 Tax=Stephania yunnanensis TaxID=152371 RepID=A0AAP0EZA7_9MAGN